MTDPVSTARSDLDDLSGSSELVTWTCTSSPCPWGDSLSNQAAVWPASSAPVTNRLGYTTSPAPYLPAATANGSTVWIDDGSASVYAGQPDASSHRLLVTLAAGDSYPVAGLAEGEVMSVQSDTAFAYRVTPTEPPPSGDPAQPSQTATWTCTSSPCPWGNTQSAEALVWPDDAGAIATRLGYTVSPAIYLPAARANGAHIAIDTGSASAFAGPPGDDSHRLLATITSGQFYDVEGLIDGEVLSVQSDAPFGYRASLPPPSDPDPPPDAIQAIPAFWRCNVPECIGADWTGAVINWPAWAAYQNNARSGDQSRSVFADDGTPLYPYMGAWAQGCQVTAVSGTVLIIEWQRGTDNWRETWLQPGQSHTIDLTPPEDGAMIETDDGMTSFSVTLANCTPAPLAP
ncbi:MAG TPA: hypothetical protein VLM79_29445 [Kofleriaceae bacterium]|nr:hypothetical protein [Kofleriaceae bacterium]